MLTLKNLGLVVASVMLINVVSCVHKPEADVRAMASEPKSGVRVGSSNEDQAQARIDYEKELAEVETIFVESAAKYSGRAYAGHVSSMEIEPLLSSEGLNPQEFSRYGDYLISKSVVCKIQFRTRWIDVNIVPSLFCLKR